MGLREGGAYLGSLKHQVLRISQEGNSAPCCYLLHQRNKSGECDENESHNLYWRDDHHQDTFLYETVQTEPWQVNVIHYQFLEGVCCMSLWNSPKMKKISFIYLLFIHLFIFDLIDLILLIYNSIFLKMIY